MLNWRLINKIDNLMLILSSLMLFGLFALTTANVIGRYFLHLPIDAIYCITCVILAPLVYFALSAVQKEKKHVTIAMVKDSLSPLNKLRFELAALIIQFVTFVFIAFAGLDGTIKSYQTGQTTYSGVSEVAVWPSKLAVPVGSFVLCIRLLIQIFDLIGQLRRENQ